MSALGFSGVAPGWRRAIELTDLVGEKYGGWVYDYTTAKSWDFGQAVCRQAYGPDWMNSPAFQLASEADEAPETYVNAALDMLRETPAWAIEP